MVNMNMNRCTILYVFHEFLSGVRRPPLRRHWLLGWPCVPSPAVGYVCQPTWDSAEVANAAYRVLTTVPPRGNAPQRLLLVGMGFNPGHLLMMLIILLFMYRYVLFLLLLVVGGVIIIIIEGSRSSIRYYYYRIMFCSSITNTI